MRFMTKLIGARIPLGAALALGAVSCNGGGESSIEKAMMAPDKKADAAKAKPKPAKKVDTRTPEELAAARRAAGFKSRDDIAAENAAMFEKGAREYIKTRAKEYKKLLGDMEKALARLEKSAPKWASAKDPAAAFERWKKRYTEDFKKLTQRYDTLTERGAKGGNTQAIFGKTFRTWEGLNGDLGPKISENARFGQVLAELRDGLGKVRAAVEEIEKDASLVSNKFHESDAQGAQPKGKR